VTFFICSSHRAEGGTTMEELAMPSEVAEVDAVEELDYILPEGYNDETESFEEVKEEVEEVKEETEKEIETEVKEVEEEAILEDFEVKFLKDVKQLKDIPRDELKNFIEKGMNYDRYQDKQIAINEQNEQFADLAKMFDMDTPKLIETLQQQFFENKAKEESRNVDDVKSEYNRTHKDLQAKMVDRFNAKYPDVDVSKLPDGVMDAIAKGEDMTSAYEADTNSESIKAKDSEIESLQTQVKDLEKQLGVKKQNAKTKSKAVVKTVGGTDSDHNDDFLQGLFSD